MIKTWEVRLFRLRLGLNLNTRHWGVGVVLHSGEPRNKDFGYVGVAIGPCEFWIDGQGRLVGKS